MTDKIVSIEGMARLCRAGLFADDQLVGITKHGAAVYAHQNVVVVRPAGPRPAGVEPYRRGARN